MPSDRDNLFGAFEQCGSAKVWSTCVVSHKKPENVFEDPHPNDDVFLSNGQIVLLVDPSQSTALVIG